MHARHAGSVLLRAWPVLSAVARQGARVDASALQLGPAAARAPRACNSPAAGLSTASYEELRSYLQSLKQGASPVSPAQARELQRDIEATYLEPASGSGPAAQLQQHHPQGSHAAAAAPAPGAPARGLQRRPSIEPHHLAEAVWAFATMKHHHDELFREVARYAVRTNLALLPPASAARFVWAYAELRVYDARLFTELAAACLRKARDFTARQLADVVWAFASMQHRDAELYRALGRAAFRQLYSFPPHALARVAWAFSQVGHYHEAFHLAAVGQLADALPKLRPLEVAQFATAVSVLGPAGHEALDRIAAAAARDVAKYPRGTWQQLVDALQAVQHKQAPLLAGLSHNCASSS